MIHLNSLTPDQRKEYRKKGLEKRKQNIKWAEENLRMVYADDKLWRELARKHQYRLPIRTQQAGARHVNKFLKHFGLSREWYKEHTGYIHGNKESEDSPSMNAVQQIGILLEHYDDDYKD